MYFGHWIYTFTVFFINKDKTFRENCFNDREIASIAIDRPYGDPSPG